MLRKQNTLHQTSIYWTFTVYGPMESKTADSKIAVSKGLDGVVRNGPVLSASRVLGRHRKECH